MTDQVRHLTLTLAIVAASPLLAQESILPDFSEPRPRTTNRERLTNDAHVTLIKDCIVQPLSEPVLYAAESGKLTLVPEVGDEVKEGDVIAKTDDIVAQLQLRVKAQEYKAEWIKLESDVEVRYAQKQAEVREAFYLVAEEANKKAAGAVSPTEVRRRKFDWEGSLLSIEKTDNDRQIARAAAEVKLAEYELAKEMVARHEIRSMVSGTVQERLKHVGEWVKPGDPIVQLIRMDRLRVIGHIDLRNCPPHRLKGLPVIIELPTRFDRDGNPVTTIDIPSTIIHVGVRVGDNDDFPIWAEFENTEDLAGWPGIPNVRMRLDIPEF